MAKIDNHIGSHPMQEGRCLAHHRYGCINCGETKQGGYETEEVGPFCAECWDYLAKHFAPRCKED